MTSNKKALLVTTVSGFIPQFEMNHVKLLQSMGFEIHYATNYHTPSYGKDNHRLDGTGIIRHQVDFVRSPFKRANVIVYRQLRTLMTQEHFDLVHCHTPMGGVMARLAAYATHTGPVIYTAHGFHFYKGAPIPNWLCYYPMERVLSRFTDQQICINQEDFTRAKKSFHAKYVDYIPGVGIDFSRFPNSDEKAIADKKKELNLPSDKILILSSGELIKRKNHETVIRAIAKIRNKHTDTENYPLNFHYIICGHGKLQDYLMNLVTSLGLTDFVTFLGYREDMLDIYKIADLFIFPSYQEGLPIALLEAMASRLPVICSDIRGNQDLMGEILSESEELEFCHGGIMVKKPDYIDSYCQAILMMLEDTQYLPKYGIANQEQSKHFSEEQVIDRMRQIYSRLCD